MKKILAIMLVAALALALVACGGTPASSGSTASTAASGSHGGFRHGHGPDVRLYRVRYVRHLERVFRKGV